MNPFRRIRKSKDKVKAVVTASTNTPVTAGTKDIPRALGITNDGRVVESASPIVDSKGRFNVGAFHGGDDLRTKREFLANIDYMRRLLSSGQLKVESATTKREIETAYYDRLEYLASTIRNNPEAGLREVANELIAVVNETFAREGFATKILANHRTDPGAVPQVRVRDRKVAVSLTNSVTGVGHIISYKPGLIPVDVVDVLGYVLMNEHDIRRLDGMILEEKYEDILIASMVKIDRYVKQLLDVATGPAMPNRPIGFVSFTPQILSTMINTVNAWGLSADTLLVSVDLWNDITTHPDWHTVYSPIEQHELLVNGIFGRIYNLDIITDGYRYETLQVLQPGEAYVMDSGKNLGHFYAFTQGQEEPAIEVTPIDRTPALENSRGWKVFGMIGAVVANANAVVRAKRL